MGWTFYNSSGQRLSTAATSIDVLDIDGATDIGAAIIDADLFIIDDGAGGTNRKTAASRIKTYVGGASAKSGTFTKNTADATGTQAVTGVGFQPKAVFFLAHVSTTQVSIGHTDGTTDGVVFNNTLDTDPNWGNAARIIQLTQSSTINYLGVMNSLDADGFTIGWTKTGAKTGTATIYYLAIG